MWSRLVRILGSSASLAQQLLLPGIWFALAVVESLPVDDPSNSNNFASAHVLCVLGYYVLVPRVCVAAFHATAGVMTASRAESQQSHFGRRRSNTTQSILRQVPPTINPLKVGESKVLNLWVHDTKDSPSILFNHSWWPGVTEGDLLRVTSVSAGVDSSFLFVVPKEDGSAKPQLQVSICYSRVYIVHLKTADFSPGICGKCVWTEKLRRSQCCEGRFTSPCRSVPSCVLIVFQVDKASCLADYVEFVFQDQYLGRNEMWRLSQHLVGQCVYKNQEVSFIGSIGVRIQAIYVGGEKVLF